MMDSSFTSFGGGSERHEPVGASSSSFDYRQLLPSFGGGGDAETGGNVYHMSNSDADVEDDIDLCSYFPEMTLRERLLGCGTCMIAGYLLSFGSFWRIKDLLLGNPLPFVLNATVGNLLALVGSCFLSGPKSQYNRMWHESRKTATTVYLGSLGLTLIVAFIAAIPLRAFLLICLMICQYCAITWYCLSYVPFAREAIAGYFARRFAGGGGTSS